MGHAGRLASERYLPARGPALPPPGRAPRLCAATMFELVPATSLAAGLIWLYGWEYLRRTRAKAPAAAEH